MGLSPVRGITLILAVSAGASSQLAAAAGPDFDGDGFDDLVVGIPFEDLGAANAGAVEVIYGSSAGLTGAGDQFWHQNAAGIADASEAEDQFGSALAWGDFDGDGFDDLAIGIMNENVGSIVDAGAVCVLYGSVSGLSAAGNQLWHQNSPGVLDSAEPGDRFGEALTAGDFNGDGFDDLAVGVPNEDVGAIGNAGAVNVLYGSLSGLNASGDQLWHQDSPDILDLAEASDEFGDSLAAGDFDGDGRDDLVIGVEDEDVGIVNDAGAVNVIYGSASGLSATGNQYWHQDSPLIDDVAEDGDDFGDALATGDFDGDGFDDLAISVDLEEVGTANGAGMVSILYGTAAGLSAAGSQVWHQDSAGIADVAETSDHFGADLVAGDFNGDGFADLAIGVEGESVGSIASAGAVNVVYGSSAGLSASDDEFWHQNRSGVLDAAEAGDMFGDAVSAGDYDGDGRDDLAVGSEGEDVGGTDTGSVNVLYGVPGGLNGTGDQFWHQNSPSIIDVAQPVDRFGSVL